MSITLQTLRRSARMLLRSARSERVSEALPSLRRMQRAGVLPSPRLAESFAQRRSIRLKHALRTIAVECGAASWEALVAAGASLDAAQLARFRLEDRPRSAYLNHWFADEASARAHQAVRGGHVVPFGTQALVCDDPMYATLVGSEA